MTAILGLDIGGANLKAAHTSGAARTVAFPLWKHPERLTAELVRLCASMPASERFAITMTGELCDCFATKRDGVHAILESVRTMSANIPVQIWSTKGLFLGLEEACETPLAVASANWYAQARLEAAMFPRELALLIDTGSTTTDLVYLEHGEPRPRAFTDPERLVSGELVYTGVRRTPLCAVLHAEVASELFATMLDAYVYLGRWPEARDDCDTADGRPVTRTCAHARLARMRCADVETFSPADARMLAEAAVTAQLQVVTRAMDRVLADRPTLDRVIVSGSGECLALSVARRCSAPITRLAEVLGPTLSEAACAYAVAVLAAQE